MLEIKMHIINDKGLVLVEGNVKYRLTDNKYDELICLNQEAELVYVIYNTWADYFQFTDVTIIDVKSIPYQEVDNICFTETFQLDIIHRGILFFYCWNVKIFINVIIK